MAQVQGAQAAPAAGQSLRETLSRGQIVLALVAVLLGMFLSSLNSTIVGTAMPRIIAELNGLDHYAWVFTAYMLASTVVVPVVGKLSDLYGRRPFYMGGMVIFLIGMALSGTSQNLTQLILYRAVQGLGAGALMPIVQAVIGDIFPPAERGKWQGLTMGVFGLSSIIGPSLGGWLTDNWGWRWVFYVNIPLGFVALAVAFFALPRQSRRRQHRIDYLGAGLLLAWSIPLLLAFSWGGSQYAWASAQVVGLLAVALVGLVAFLVLESRAAEAIINPRFFRTSIFTVSVVATFMVAVGMYGAMLYLPLFAQGVLGDSATASGAVLTPMMLGFVASSIIGGQILSRTGQYKPLALVSFVIATVGAWLLSRMGPAASDGLVARNMVVLGLGIGATMSMFTIVVQNAFPFRQLGQVTSSLQFFRSIGGTVGTAILGSVLTNHFQANFQAGLPAAVRQAVPADKLAAFGNPEVLLAPGVLDKVQAQFGALGPQGQALFQQLILTVRASLAAAIDDLFVISAGAMVLAFLTTLFLKQIPLRKGFQPEAPAARPAPAPVATPLLLGTALALVAREAQQPAADPALLARLSALVDGQLPADWSARERARVLASDVLEPLAVHLLAQALPLRAATVPVLGRPAERAPAYRGAATVPTPALAVSDLTGAVRPA